jgi:hypothetical protein
VSAAGDGGAFRAEEGSAVLIGVPPATGEGDKDERSQDLAWQAHSVSGLLQCNVMKRRSCDFPSLFSDNDQIPLNLFICVLEFATFLSHEEQMPVRGRRE